MSVFIHRNEAHYERSTVASQQRGCASDNTCFTPSPSSLGTPTKSGAGEDLRPGGACLQHTSPPPLSEASETSSPLAARLYRPPLGVKALFRLGRDEAYNKTLCLCSRFHSKGKMLYGPDLLWVSASAYIYIYLQSRKELFVTSFIYTTRETEAWRGLPHCDRMLGFWVACTWQR